MLAPSNGGRVDSVALTAYMGESERFEAMMQAFALQYAEQNAQDFQRYTAAIASGEVSVTDDASRAVRMSLQPSNPQGPLVVSEVPSGS